MRSAAAGHRLYDAVRGAKVLVPQGTDAEAFFWLVKLTSAGSAGFSLGSNITTTITLRLLAGLCSGQIAIRLMPSKLLATVATSTAFMASAQVL